MVRRLAFPLSILLFFLLITVGGPVANAQSVTVRVDPATQYQTFEGWGTSLCWFAHVLGGAPDTLRTRYANLLFDRTTGLGLNVVRYNIGGGEAPGLHYLQPRAQVPGFEPAQGTYDWTQDANQRWFLQAAMARGADQQEAFSNSPPYWMTNSGSVTGSSNGTSDNLKPAFQGAFADYLATVVQHFQTAWGVTFRSVEPLNEPVAWWWKLGGGQEGCHFDPATQNTMVKALGSALSGKQLLTRVSASDENAIDDAVNSFRALDSSALAVLGKVNTHSYNGSRRVGLWDLAQSAGKSLWMSEYGDGDGSGMTLSEQILADMRTMHPAAWVYWQAIDDSSAPGWGMLYSNLNAPTNYAVTFNKKYYVMANYSKFIRPGYTFIFCDDGQTLAAYSQAMKTLVLVTTNNTATDRSVTYDLSNFQSLPVSAMAYRTSPTENLLSVGNISIASKKLVALAKAHSVTSYLVRNIGYAPTIAVHANDNTTGTGLNQFSYVGTWTYNSAQSGAYQHDEHRSNVPNASYTFAFSGPQALVYASLGPDRGIAAFSIDDGPENEVDLYAAALSNTLVYASPTLPNGGHTLHVRVTGRKHPASKDTIVTADRIDIVAASANPVQGVYTLVNRNSGNVMDVNQASTTPGATVIQWPTNGGANQIWNIGPTDGNWLHFINVNSGLYLDVDRAMTSAGAVTIQWSPYATQSQQWSFTPVGGVYYKIVNRNSGLSLDVNGASLQDGASVIQWYDNGGANQQWALLRQN